MLASLEINEDLILQDLNRCSRGNVFSLWVLVAALSVGIETPGKSLSVLINGERVVGSCTDPDHGLDTNRLGCQSVQHSARDNAAAKLHLLSVTPAVNVSCGVQGEDVIGSSGDIDNVGELMHSGRFILDLCTLGVSQNALCALFVVEERKKVSILQ